MERGFLGDFPPSQQPKCTVSYNGFLGRTPREAQAWEAGKEPEAASQKGRSLARTVLHLRRREKVTQAAGKPATTCQKHFLYHPLAGRERASQHLILSLAS